MTERTWKAVADLYQSLFAGLVVRTVVQRGAADGARLVFQTYRTQHLRRFLPGLDKLGLTGLPHAVAAAQYHYLSNKIGGVAVEFIPETDRKAWIRFPPPRWIWKGIAICGIPTEVSEAMLRAWQAHNGVSLGNPRLGFVCTKMAVDGDPGLEGYFLEYDRDLAPDERLRFARDEAAPPFDPAKAPVLNWPQERLAKAHRSYAMEYNRSAFPACADLFGAEAARYLAGGAARLVGMQLYAEIAEALGVPPDSTPEGFIGFLAAFLTAQGDELATVTPRSVTAAKVGMLLLPGAAADCWASLIEGFAAAHNHRMVLRRQGLTWSVGDA